MRSRPQRPLSSSVRCHNSMSEELPELHDATLLSIQFDWALAQCELTFDGGPAFPGHFSLVWSDVEELVVPRKNSWGESASVLSAQAVAPTRYEFQMQSGDVIAVVSPNYSFKRTAAGRLR